VCVCVKGERERERERERISLIINLLLAQSAIVPIRTFIVQ